MPHYADGQPAASGDIVQGKGYNIKNSNGELGEFVGMVIDVTSEGDYCNLALAVPVIGDLPEDYVPGQPHAFVPQGAAISGGRYVKLAVEFGQADHFTLVPPLGTEATREDAEA